MRSGRTMTFAVCMAVSAALLLSGCSNTPKGEPAISGDVTAVDNAAQGGIVMLVEAPGGTSYSVGDKASVSVTDKTKVVDETGAKVEPRGITVGQRVDVWFEGPVAESYPVQGTAGYVRVYQRGTAPPNASGP
ncbi:MAG: DUF3221 domain-containing protein [Coriobacteriales bacterium]|nr:DUF3221 domain-containing protein [Coriobacteriales bacterium]